MWCQTGNQHDLVQLWCHVSALHLLALFCLAWPDLFHLWLIRLASLVCLNCFVVCQVSSPSLCGLCVGSRSFSDSFAFLADLWVRPVGFLQTQRVTSLNEHGHNLETEKEMFDPLNHVTWKP